MYRVAICDDCAEDGQQIFAHARQFFLDHNIDAAISLFCCPSELLVDIKKKHTRYDLLLLDILMGKTSGIELAKAIRSLGSRALLVFVTVSRDYAINGYKVQANDYLVKPVTQEDLSASLGRLMTKNDTLLLEIDGAMKPILLSEIQYAESLGHHVILRTVNHDETARLRATLSEVQNKLGNNRFARCHKGYLVNLSQVREIRVSNILLHSGDTVPLGRQYRLDLQTEMIQYMKKAIPL